MDLDLSLTLGTPGPFVEQADAADLQQEQNPFDLNEFPPVHAFLPTVPELMELLMNYIIGGFDTLNEDFKRYFGVNLQVENFFTQLNHNNLTHNYYFARRVPMPLPGWKDFGRVFLKNNETKGIIGHSRVFQKEGTNINIAEYRCNIQQGKAEIVLCHIKSRD